MSCFVSYVHLRSSPFGSFSLVWFPSASYPYVVACLLPSIVFVRLNVSALYSYSVVVSSALPFARVIFVGSPAELNDSSVSEPFGSVNVVSFVPYFHLRVCPARVSSVTRWVVASYLIVVECSRPSVIFVSRCGDSYSNFQRTFPSIVTLARFFEL